MGNIWLWCKIWQVLADNVEIKEILIHLLSIILPLCIWFIHSLISHIIQWCGICLVYANRITVYCTHVAFICLFHLFSYKIVNLFMDGIMNTIYYPINIANVKISIYGSAHSLSNVYVLCRWHIQARWLRWMSCYHGRMVAATRTSWGCTLSPAGPSAWTL